MSNKLLSIIVPAYNMEAYLAQCIESVVPNSPLRDRVEVVVVNDGSKDETSNIAHRYAEKYPDIVRVIDKENGHYGSTINAALEVARGEYVKILDADDMFDVDLMDRFLEALSLGVDMVITPFIEVGNNCKRKIGYNLYSRNVYEERRAYDMEQILGDGAIRFFMMHGVCYRTQILLDMAYRQSEGIAYTDQEWVFYPLFKVESVAFADVPIYQYNTTREGRSMDAQTQIRSISQLVSVTEALARYFVANRDTLPSPVREAFLRNNVADKMKIVYRKYLLAMPNKVFAISDFEAVDKRLTALLAECGIEGLKVPVNNLLKVDLLARWCSKARRHSTFVRCLLSWVDEAMVWAHSILFRRK